MKGAFQIARIFGIPVQIHWTFGFLILLVFYMSYSRGWNLPALLQFSGFFVVLFACVVFHEFGHALTARRFGVETRDIILSPIGGVARLNKLPETPMQEFLVAAAGPMVNIAIALVTLPYIIYNPKTWQQLLNVFDPNSNVFLSALSFLEYFFLGLFLLNATLALFNLLPAFPMDGGRILRAALSVPLGRIRATRIAAIIGQFLAVFLIAFGAWEWNLLTIFIGFFVFATAANENRMVQIDDLLEKHEVSEVVRRYFTRIYENDDMERPVEQLAHGLERNFLVFDHWQNLIGTLEEKDLMKVVRKKDFGSPVTGYLNRDYESILITESLRTALARIQSNEGGILPVYEKGGLVGVIDLQSINTFLKMQDKKNKLEKKKLRP